jgi:RNA polymerase sigma factor (sigma-70 family)
MVGGQRNPVFRYLRRLAGAPPGGDPSDEELLQRFARHGDEGAFTTIVEKYGPMVLGVCRRILSNLADVEDAFQATFLVLVRKAGSLRQPGSLASWLYGVAYRTAIKARAMAAQRRFHETQVMNIQASKPVSQAGTVDLKELLDEEVSRLPARYRLPFVFCYLAGKTNEEAARELGCAPGTIYSRLSRAREMLRSRLTRRGITLSAAGLATALAETTGKAAVPSTLVEATVKSAIVMAAGKGLAAGAISTSVFTLTKGVQQAMFINTLKITLGVIVGVGLTITAVAGAQVALLALSHDSSKDEKVPRKGATASNANPDEKKQETLKKEDDQKKTEERALRKYEGKLNLRRLEQERVDTAKKEFEARMYQFEAGKGTLDFLIAASKRWLKAETGAIPSGITEAYLQAHFERMKKIQDINQQRFDEGRISIEDLALAKYYRLEAEIWLERCKAGAILQPGEP